MSIMLGGMGFILIVLMGLITMGFWIWALIDCLLRSDESYEKMFGTISPRIVWALIIFFGHFIGALIYLFVAGSRKNPKRVVIKLDPAGTEEGKRIIQMIADGKVTADEGQRLLLALGKKEMEQADLQTASRPQALKIGCGIFMTIFMLGFLLFAMVTCNHVRGARAKAIMMKMQNRDKLGGPLGLIGGEVPAPAHSQNRSKVKIEKATLLTTGAVDRIGFNKPE